MNDNPKAQVEALGRRVGADAPDEIGFVARTLLLAAREELADLGGGLPHVVELVSKIDDVLAAEAWATRRPRTFSGG